MDIEGRLTHEVMLCFLHAIYGRKPLALKLLRLPDVKARTGLSRSSIYLRMSEGSFPTSVPLGARAVGWVESEIENFLESRIKARASVELKRVEPIREEVASG